MFQIKLEQKQKIEGHFVDNFVNNFMEKNRTFLSKYDGGDKKQLVDLVAYFLSQNITKSNYIETLLKIGILSPVLISADEKVKYIMEDRDVHQYVKMARIKSLLTEAKK
ncbi:MAG: hypothetical protein ABW168_24000 [Sedimenticola sp.]